MPCLLQRWRGTCALLIEGAAREEALKPECRVERVRRVVGDRVREHPARPWRGLEAAVAPASVDIEVVNRQAADDRAAVHGHIDETAPCAQEPQAADEWHQVDGVAHDL